MVARAQMLPPSLSRARACRRPHAAPRRPPPPPKKKITNTTTQARDAFYECLREAGVLPSPGQAPPPRCAQARRAFERSCLPSWVAHFDEQQLRESARRATALGQAIRAGAGTAAGGLAGKAQQ